jgi:hypothetical protein
MSRARSRHHVSAHLLANVGIVLLFAAFYVRFLKLPERPLSASHPQGAPCRVRVSAEPSDSEHLAPTSGAHINGVTPSPGMTSGGSCGKGRPTGGCVLLAGARCHGGRSPAESKTVFGTVLEEHHGRIPFQRRSWRCSTFRIGRGWGLAARPGWCGRLARPPR